MMRAHIKEEVDESVLATSWLNAIEAAESGT
jgi:hypothetical protein